MNTNTSIALGNYFEHFVASRISQGRYKNASEVIRAGLRLLEEEENQFLVLKNAIQEGLESGIATGFNPKTHLESLRERQQNG
jgi:antitoxin ParD1/3/4